MAVQHCLFFSSNPPFLQLARRDEADRGHCKARCSFADARRFHEFTFRSPRGLQPFFLLERLVSFLSAWKAFTRPTLLPYSRGAMSFARCARSSLCAKSNVWGEEWRLRFVNPTPNQGGGGEEVLGTIRKDSNNCSVSRTHPEKRPEGRPERSTVLSQGIENR